MLLFAAYVTNLFGPPPPGVDAIAVAGNAMWLFVLAGWWVDRSRSVHHYPHDAIGGSGSDRCARDYEGDWVGDSSETTDSDAVQKGTSHGD